MKLVYVFSAVAVLTACSPKLRAAPEVKAPEGEAVIQRGRYLAENVLGCVECHSQRDFSQPGAPIIPGTEFAGGILFDPSFIMNGPFPGTLQARNISQSVEHGIGGWSDGEILRAMREGVRKNGEAMFPMMPYPNFRALSDEDALSVIAYLRTIAPKDGTTVERDLDFPLNLIVNTIPEPLDGPVSAPATDVVARGKYLVTVGGCHDCHSPANKGERLEGQELGGGVVIVAPKIPVVGTVVSSNLTPDAETGLGKVTEAQFLEMIREGKGKDGRPLRPIMPWLFMRNMTDDDLKAIYAYLHTVPPVKKDVFVELAKYSQAD